MQHPQHLEELNAEGEESTAHVWGQAAQRVHWPVPWQQSGSSLKGGSHCAWAALSSTLGIIPYTASVHAMRSEQCTMAAAVTIWQMPSKGSGCLPKAFIHCISVQSLTTRQC